MADATLQILGLGSGAVPIDYNVTGNQDLDLIAVKADFDGTSALVDFVPVVEILSDADHVMAQSKGPTVTAGDSATVTFAPFLDEPAAASTGGITEIISGDGSVTVTSPFGAIVGLTVAVPPVGNSHYQATTGSITSGNFADFSWSHIDGTSLLNLASATVPKVTTAGHYGFVMRSQSGGNLGAGREIKMQAKMADPTPGPAPVVISDYVPGVLVNPDFFISISGWLPVNGTFTGTMIVVDSAAGLTFTGDLWVTKFS